MIEIRITAETLNDAVKQIAGFADTAVVKDKPKKTKVKQEVKDEPVLVEVPEEVTADDPVKDTEPIPDAVTLRAAAQEKAKTPEGKAAIKELLKQYDSKSISTIPEDKRADFLKDVEAI